MIGIDLVSIERMQKVIARFGDHAIEKFLSEKEAALCGKKIETIAGFWAAKEAVSKAIGCGIGGELCFLDIKITKSKLGQPIAALKKGAAKRLKIKNISISITHEKSYAIAAAIVEK